MTVLIWDFSALDQGIAFKQLKPRISGALLDFLVGSLKSYKQMVWVYGS